MFHIPIFDFDLFRIFVLEFCELPIVNETHHKIFLNGNRSSLRQTTPILSKISPAWVGCVRVVFMSPPTPTAVLGRGVVYTSNPSGSPVASTRASLW